MMFLTVGDFMHMEEVTGLRLAGGEKGLENHIQSINITDSPDILRWLKKKELLLTTGYIFKDDDYLRKDLIQTMHLIGCSGLAIKTKRYFETIPEDMVAEANRYGLPLIEVPPHYSFAHISSIFYKEMYNLQKMLMKKTYDIHTQLMSIVLEGATLDRIGAEVAHMIGNPIIILDEKGYLLAYGKHPENPLAFQQELSLRKGTPILKSSILQRLSENISANAEAIKIEYPFQGEEVIIRVKPIVAMGSINGYILILETIKKMTRIDYVTIEQAAIILALERLKQKAVEDTKHMLRKDFFDDLLEGRIDSINALHSLCGIHGLDIHKKYLCLIVKVQSSQSYEDEISYTNEIYRLCKEIIRLSDDIHKEQKRRSVSICRKNHIITFFQCHETEDEILSKTAAKHYADLLYESIQHAFPGLPVTIGIGKKYDSIMDIRLSFNEAFEALRMLQRTPKNRTVIHFDDFMVYHLLDTGTDQEKLRSFYSHTVKNLVDYDRENNSCLVPTLEAFFANNGNISEAAKEIFVHRNTFMYRLDKIKAILHTELKNPEELLEIQLGLRAMHLLNPLKTIK